MEVLFLEVFEEGDPATICSVCGKEKELVWAKENKEIIVAINCDCGLSKVC